MTWLRVVTKLPALFVVTLSAAFLAATGRLLCFGRTRPSAWVGSQAGRAWSRLACAILRIRLRVDGRPTGRPFLVAANHLSYVDIWVFGALYPSIFVAKREIAGWPGFGWVARAAGTLFVDRETPRDVVRVGRRMSEHLALGISLTVFPEGGTSDGEQVRPFLSAILEPAARDGASCWAASISYETPGAPPPPTLTICWGRGRPFLRHLLGIMRLRRVEASVSFSKVPVRSTDRKELARRLWEHARESFVPVRRQWLPPECAP